jgi:hypothetical protein
MVDRLRPRHRRGHLQLVLISSAGAVISGCAPDPIDTPVALSRAQYASVEDCLQDWRDESECEPQRDTTASGGGASSGGARRLVWWGPYYTRSGQVYRYNGRIEQMPVQVNNAQQVINRTMTAREVYAAPSGRYFGTPPAPDASAAKTAAARSGAGGFGGTGRGLSGGG